MAPSESAKQKEIERIVKQYSTMLLRVAINQTANRADAEDIVQKVFLKLLEKERNFESEEHEKAWLIRVTLNLCKDMFKSSWHKKTTNLEDTMPTKTKENEFEMIDIIQQLPEKYRSVIYLFYYEGYTTAEIAAVLNKRKGTVESHLHRARAKLQALLDSRWELEQEK